MDCLANTGNILAHRSWLAIISRTKNFANGEGGALFINDPVLMNAEIVRERHKPLSFFRGQVINTLGWILAILSSIRNLAAFIRSARTA
jgi:hypothetical protein